MGHFLAGRWLGFDVYEFAIGFGPKIFKKQKKGTIFSVRALPLGGFVAFDDEKNVENGELSFDKKPVWKRLMVILAGPVMNIVTALVIMIGIYTVAGVDLPAEYFIESVDLDSPAYEAGMQEGDTFFIVEGVPVDGNYDVIINGLQSGDGVDITVLRDGEPVELFVTPEYIPEEERYKIGIGLEGRFERDDVTFGGAIKAGFAETYNMTKSLVVFLGKLIFKGEGAKDVGSIVSAVVVMNDVAKQMDLYYFLYILAFVSINLGVFNLLPIPPMDGFRVVMYLYEGIRGKKIPFEVQMKLQMAGFILLFGLSAVLIYRDVVRYFIGG